MAQKLLSKSSNNRTTKDYKNNHVKRTPTCVCTMEGHKARKPSRIEIKHIL